MKNQPFSSFCVTPSGVRFEKQNKDEVILLLLRAHFITNVSWIIIFFILLSFPLFLSIFLPNFESFIFFIPQNFFVFFTLFYYLLIGIYAFIRFISWFYNVFIVTQKRVIDIDYSQLVYSDVSITEIGLIEDARYVKTSFLDSLFNMGDIIVQTAGEKENFEARSVPDPQYAVKIISDIMQGVQPHV